MSSHPNTVSAILGLLKEQNTVTLCGLYGSCNALVLAELVRVNQKSVCCLVADDEQLETLANDIRLFTDTEILVYPSFEIPPYTPLSPDPVTVANRLTTLYRLVNTTEPHISLVSVEAVLRRVLPKNVLNNSCELLMAGEDTDRDALISSLSDSGYQNCSMVQHIGDLSVRGSIIDIFAPSLDGAVATPLRLDFFGDNLESIRYFDPITQRSIREIKETIILPCSDILFPKGPNSASWKDYLKKTVAELQLPPKGAAPLLQQLRDHIRFAGIEFFLPLVYPEPEPAQSFFDYLPDDYTVVLLDPADIGLRTNLVRDRIAANYQETINTDTPALPPEKLFIPEEELQKLLKRSDNLHLSALPDPDSKTPYHSLKTGDHTLLKQEIKLQGKRQGILAPLADRIINWHHKEHAVILTCRSHRQAGHFQEMLKRYRIDSSLAVAPLDINTISTDTQVQLIEHPLASGFDLFEQKVHILSASELFGDRRIRPERSKPAAGGDAKPILIEELASGDLVVHRDHGIGLFQGLINMSFTGHQGDFLQIEYRAGDKLYVPVDKLHWVNRYQGLSEQNPRLDRLGSETWKATKKKVTEAVWQVAQELVEIYAQREIRRGKRFSPPGELFQELEQSFPYEETSGQNKAITEVIDDLTSDKPTDRLICGDVGYGKTEVAVRAAFKVIEDGYQVAILVPTTVLAEQHAATFRERYASFSVNIACINRFRTAAQQRSIAADITSGKLDLVIGTHRLLSKDIKFAKLGLMIIDEEHRFGVAHKEKIKKLKAEVDIITLTATPIPRTLQMSLLGIRDLSVISTPPRRRRSIKTFLAKNDDLVIKEAIIKEMLRNGQLFLVHNRVRSIHRVAEKIQGLVPHARTAVAHGQMSGRDLEDVMVKFINHEIDVLVCTTIIESGLDISNANTIIINRADRLGLADIYQLRGRVGRSEKQSYAYLLVPSLDTLTKDAKQRLRALMDCNELGGGFKLAMNDLQIRGGGNLLGVSQSGHIAAVGYDLYLELLQATVADLRNGAASKETAAETAAMSFDPEIKLRISAFLPQDYIRDPSQRFQQYRRISATGNSSPAELQDLRDELIDRYGPLPEEAKTFFEMVGLKYQLRLLGIEKLEQGPEILAFSFREQTPVEPPAILSLIKEKPRKKEKPIRLTPDNRLLVPLPNPEELFQKIIFILDQLQSASGI